MRQENISLLPLIAVPWVQATYIMSEIRDMHMMVAEASEICAAAQRDQSRALRRADAAEVCVLFTFLRSVYTAATRRCSIPTASYGSMPSRTLPDLKLFEIAPASIGALTLWTAQERERRLQEEVWVLRSTFPTHAPDPLAWRARLRCLSTGGSVARETRDPSRRNGRRAPNRFGSAGRNGRITALEEEMEAYAAAQESKIAQLQARRPPRTRTAPSGKATLDTGSFPLSPAGRSLGLY
jgi:hypothetical protein